MSDIDLQELLRKIQEEYPDLWPYIEEMYDLFMKKLQDAGDPETKRRLLALLQALLFWITKVYGKVPVEISRLVAYLQRLLPYGAATGEGAAVAEGGGAAATFLGLPLGGGALAVGSAFAVMLAALALLGYSIYHTATTKPVSLAYGPVCSPINAASGLGPISASGVLENQVGLYNEVQAKAQMQCDTYASKCQAGCHAPTACKPNVSLQDFDISDYWVYRKVTFLKFNCVCECL